MLINPNATNYHNIPQQAYAGTACFFSLSPCAIMASYKWRWKACFASPYPRGRLVRTVDCDSGGPGSIPGTGGGPFFIIIWRIFCS